MMPPRMLVALFLKKKVVLRFCLCGQPGADGLIREHRPDLVISDDADACDGWLCVLRTLRADTALATDL
jgi:hypothetical protein